MIAALQGLRENVSAAQVQSSAEQIAQHSSRPPGPRDIDMAWLLLIVGGLLEVGWSQSIKPTNGFTRPLPTLLCFALTSAVIYPRSPWRCDPASGNGLRRVHQHLANGAVVLGVVISHDPVSAGRLTALGLIVSGVVIARLTT